MENGLKYGKQDSKVREVKKPNGYKAAMKGLSRNIKPRNPEGKMNCSSGGKKK